jgi:hypothetical protein
MLNYDVDHPFWASPQVKVPTYLLIRPSFKTLAREKPSHDPIRN